MSYKFARKTVSAAQTEAALLQSMQDNTPSSTRIAANDSLYDELEMRYGGAFAQWIVDGMKP